MPSPEYEPQPILLDRFVALDLDRTVLKSTHFFKKYVLGNLANYNAEKGVDEKLFERVLKKLAEEEERQRKNAFDFLSVYNAIAEDNGAHTVDPLELAKRIIDINRGKNDKIKQEFIDEILAEGALDLIDILESEARVVGRSDWGILTTGGDLTQLLKCEVLAAILEERHEGIQLKKMIIHTEEKSQTIAADWYDEEREMFLIPAELTGGREVWVREVVMIDDKTKNLTIKKDAPGKDKVIMVQAPIAEATTKRPGDVQLDRIAEKAIPRVEY